MELEALLGQPNAVDFRGVLSPLMDLIDLDALLNENVTSHTLVDNLLGAWPCTPSTPIVSSCCK